jgi:hypothetical protein
VIERREAEAQTLRLAALTGRRDNLAEMAEALQRSASSMEHAAAIVTRLANGIPGGLASGPAAVQRVALECDPEWDPRQLRCSKCDNTGWAWTRQLHTYDRSGRKTVEEISQETYDWLLSRVSGVVGEQVVLMVVKRCLACDLGRRRAAAEEQDRAEAEAKAARKREQQAAKGVVQ